MDQERIYYSTKELGYPDLKPEQFDVIFNFVKGRDVFAVLPTGFGKTLRYASLAVIFDKILEKE